MFKKPISLLCVVVTGFCSFFEIGYSKEVVFNWQKQDSLELKELVILSLLQESTRHRIEKKLLDHEIPYTLQLDKKLLPTQFSVLFENDRIEEIDQLKFFSNEKYTYFLEDTSFLDEFDHIKNVWLEWTQKHKLLSVSSYDTKFIEELENILLETSPQDIIDHLQDEVKQDKPELATFLSLPLTDKYRQKIRLFITDFADKSMSQLVLERASMEARKEELTAVHPLRHIAFVWSNPKLIESMKTIKKANFKWTRYLKGMTRALKRHQLAGTLDEYVPGFSDFLNADKNTVQSYLDKENYKSLFEYLLKLSNTK